MRWQILFAYIRFLLSMRVQLPTGPQKRYEMACGYLVSSWLQDVLCQKVAHTANGSFVSDEVHMSLHTRSLRMLR